MQCVILYAQEFTNFRLEELNSICQLFNISIKMDLQHYDEKRPYLLVEVETCDDVIKILSRSVLMKSISILYGSGKSFGDIGETNPDLQQEVSGCFSCPSETFKFEVEVYNKRVTLQDKVFYIEEIQNYVEIPASINLKKPDVTFSLMVDFENDVIEHVYFGKLVGFSQRSSIHKYNLRTRYFIGNTTMDPQLSMIMANLAQVGPGSFCYDPFVGTGSIILACSHFGGYTGGNDIDYNIIYGRGRSSRAGNANFRARDEIISTNFENYELRSLYWDVIAGDATNIPFRVTEMFDVIVTDPPYGIREGGRKLGSKKETTWVIPEDVHDEHIPAKKLHTLSNVILDLLNFAFTYLVVGGRLVYWLPVFKPLYTDHVVPRHPGLELRGNCEQSLSTKVARRLVTMVKVKSKSECAHAQNGDDAWKATNSEDWVLMQDEFRNNYFTPSAEVVNGGKT